MSRDFLNELDMLGVPLFLLRPKANGRIKGRWEAPVGWSGRTVAQNAEVIDGWRPGLAVGALTGHTFDVVDVDTRKGGDVTLAAMVQAGQVPPVQLAAQTMSGGYHLFVPVTGMTNRASLLDGIDMRTRGGFVLVAPTEGYRALPRSAWPTLGSPDGLARLQALAVRDVLLPAREPVAGPVTPEECAKAENVLEKLLRDIRGALGARNVTVFNSLVPLYGFVKAGALSREDVDGRVWEAVQEIPDSNPYTEQEFNDSRKSAWDCTTPTRPHVDTAADDFTALDGPGGRSRLPLAVQMRQQVEAEYDVFPAGDDGRIFAQPKTGGRAELVGGSFVMRACRALGARSGSLSAAATEAAKVLSAHAEDAPARALSLRVHQEPGRIVLDLAQDDTRCVVVTPQGWTVEETPPAGVVFTRSGRALPTPERGGSVDELRALLHWDEADPRWPLIKGWLPASLLATKARPMLAFIGPQGGGKTTAARMVVGVIDPKPDGVLGSGFGKSLQDSETKAMGSYLPSWDNVSSLSGEGADFLSRLVTGDLIQRRRLYTDADLVTISYMRTGVLTAVTLPRGVKPDTLDRLILVSCDARPPVVLTDAQLSAAWDQAHPRVLGGVLDLAVQMLARQGQARGSNTARLRNADYAEALWAVDPALLDAYVGNVNNARGDMAHDDPFIQTLVAWLVKRGGEWEGTAEMARADAELFLTDAGDQWWPRSARAFSDALARSSELLAAAGLTVGPVRRTNGAKVRRYTYASEQD